MSSGVHPQVGASCVVHNEVPVKFPWHGNKYKCWRTELLKESTATQVERQNEYYMWREVMLEKLLESYRQQVSDDADAEGDEPSAPTQPIHELEKYEFTGMHTIWCEHSDAVSRVSFAHHDRSTVAFCSDDGDISICQSLPDPRPLKRIKAHSDAVTDMSWSMTNELLLSCSRDQTVKVWEVESGACVRSMECRGPLSAALFHPFNSNLIFAAVDSPSSPTLLLLNLSTGQPMQSLPCPASLTSLAIHVNGSTLFAADDQGFVSVYAVDPTGRAKRTSRSRVSDSAAGITSIQFKACFRRQTDQDTPPARPELLVNVKSGHIKILTVESSGVAEKRAYPCAVSHLPIRSTFCPLLAQYGGGCFVTGGEQMDISIYDEKKEDPLPINVLMGHSAAVLDLAWNYDESLLASCDASGAVILWKRVKKDR